MHVFINNNVQSAIDNNGYYHVKAPLLNCDEINHLTDLYYNSALAQKTDYALYNAIQSDNKDELRQITTTLTGLMETKLCEICSNFFIVYGGFLEKQPNKNVMVYHHQDGTFIDKEKPNTRSYTCWIPLTDIDLYNGCLGVINKSHTIYKDINPLPYPHVHRPLLKHAYSLLPYTTFVEMKRGEMLIFDTNTFHTSLPNISNEPRLALSFWITGSAEDLAFYYLKPATKDTLLKYRIDRSFFQKYENEKLLDLYNSNKVIDDYELMDEVPFLYKDYSILKMIREVKDRGNRYNAGTVKVLKDKFDMDVSPFHLLKQILFG